VLAWFLPSYLMLEYGSGSNSGTVSNAVKSVFHHNLLLAHCEGMATTTTSAFAQQITSSFTASCASSSTASSSTTAQSFTSSSAIPGQGVACRKLVSHSYPANNPSEDRMVIGSHDRWAYAAVFDGHGGWQVSEVASKVLLNLLLQSLEEHKECTAKESYNEMKIDQVITEVFHEMERLIIDSIRPAFQLGFGDVAKVGSCVLVALKKDDRLIISNCGDCRAILGSSNVDNSATNNNNNLQDNFYSTRINRDHNCRVPYEQLQLQLKHPKEDNLVVCKSAHACYVKGRLQLTRSLGDAYLKYQEFNGSPSKHR
jgi:pyruvate dehydrogenase phosphatase